MPDLGRSWKPIHKARGRGMSDLFRSKLLVRESFAGYQHEKYGIISLKDRIY